GFYHVMTNFQGERLVAAIGAVAGMQLLVEDALRYGTERTAFGKPLARFQVWRHRLVEHLTAIEAARWLTYRACDLFNREEPAVKEISMAKLFAGDLMQKVVYDCQQLHGGMGYVVETPVARAVRDVRLLTIGGGTSEIMKEIIAKLVTGFGAALRRGDRGRLERRGHPATRQGQHLDRDERRRVAQPADERRGDATAARKTQR